MAVITISRQYASGGDEVAALVRDRLGYRYFDKSMLRHLSGQPLVPFNAQDAAADPHKARTLAESLFSHYPESVGDSPTRHRTVEPDSGEHISLELTQSLIRAAYEEGNVVVVGRGGQMVLGGKPRALHVRIVAPLQQRIERVAKAEGLSTSAARDLVARRDKASAEYLDRFYGVEAGDPQLYDLVINLARTTPAAAADLIARAVAALPSKG